MTDLERRAGIFAALADQTRLRMVDLLTLRGLSSSEIGAQLGLPSNLATHPPGGDGVPFVWRTEDVREPPRGGRGP